MHSFETTLLGYVFNLILNSIASDSIANAKIRGLLGYEDNAYLLKKE